jgi:putative phosphoribosyl transferase
MFINRNDAGRQLAEKLSTYHIENPLVLAVPRGGVPVGHEVARSLKAELSLIIVRNLPFPYNPESGFGAIAEDGSLVILPNASRNLSEELIETIIEDQKKEIDRRIHILRGNDPLPDVVDRNVILVDDGITMGSTMRAAVRCVAGRTPASIIVAAPVSSPEAAHVLSEMQAVNDIVVLLKPRFFLSVAQNYQNLDNIPDYEVIKLLSNPRDHIQQ